MSVSFPLQQELHKLMRELGTLLATRSKAESHARQQHTEELRSLGEEQQKEKSKIKHVKTEDAIFTLDRKTEADWLSEGYTWFLIVGILLLVLACTIVFIFNAYISRTNNVLSGCFFGLVFALIGGLLAAFVVPRLLHKRALSRSAQEHKQVEQDFEQKRYALKSHLEEELSAFEQNLRVSIEALKSSFEKLADQDIPATSPWKEPVWKKWTTTTNVPDIIRLGELKLNKGQVALSVPAFFPFPGGRSLLFRVDGPAKAKAVQAIQSLLLRLLATVPPTKLRFTFIDPAGLGQNIAPFMGLADYDESLVSSRAWTEPQHIEKRLADLTEHMENVIQKYLRNQFATIEEFNAQAGEVAEPYRVLVVFDFPVNFSEETAQRLASIIQNGPRCGIYPVVLVDTVMLEKWNKNRSQDLTLAKPGQTTLITSLDGKRFVWTDGDIQQGCDVELDTPPDTDFFNHVLSTVGEAAKAASRVEVPFERVIPSPDQWWKGDTRDGLHVSLGPAGARQHQYLDLGHGTSQHVLIGGKTGSGKSTLLHVLIANLALECSPDEIELYLVDFKKGIEFKAYAAYELPHARVVAIESEREFGLSVLQGLDTKIKERGDTFRAAGVDNIADYRRKTGQPMPRILLLVDEFQEFFTEDDTIASQAAQLLDRLVRQGRAFGVHVLLGSQTLAGSYTLARSTIDQMAVRIALQCSEADSRLILADDNPAARLLSRPGEAIYNDANGLVEGNHPFQVAWLSDDERNRYLAQIQTLVQERGYRPPQPQIIFEGNAPADVAKNRTLKDLLTTPEWSTPARRVSVWLGDPIAIKEPTAAYFRRQSGSNLLIVGQNDEAALGMLATALISLAAQHTATPSQTEGQSKDARFYILDLGPVDAPYADFFSKLADILPHSIQYSRPRKLSDIISEIAAEVSQRLEEEEVGMWVKPAIYLFIYGLQRARDLRQTEDFGSSSFNMDEPTPPNPAQQFSTILREGPELGVHTLAWCDTLNNLNRTLDRQALREFEMRVVFQMSAEDSANLIDTPAANKLGPYRALFYSDEEGRIEKFRPYSIPSDEWMEWVGQQLLKKIPDK